MPETKKKPLSFTDDPRIKEPKDRDWLQESLQEQLKDPLKDKLSPQQRHDKLQDQGLWGQQLRDDTKKHWEGGGKHLGVGVTAGVAGTTVGLSTGNTDLGTGSPMGVVGFAKLLESGLTVRSGRKKQKEGELNDDKGLVTMGKKDVKTGKSGLVQNSVGMTGTTLKTLDTVGKLGSVGTKFIPGLSLVGSLLSGGVATRRLVKQIKRTKGLAKEEMATDRGRKWKKLIDERNGLQKRMSSLQIALAAAGIVGSTLLILSNPVGWLVGAVAALGGAGIAMHRIGKNIKNKYKTVDLIKRNRLADRAFSKGETPSLTSISRLMTKDMRTQKGKNRKILKDGTLVRDKKSGKKNQQSGLDDPPEKTGFEHLYEPTKTPEKIDPKRRKELKKEADEIQRMVSKMAALGGELQTVAKEQGQVYWREIRDWRWECQRIRHRHWGPEPKLVLSEEALEYQDVDSLLEILGMTVDELTSDSGQQLFEQKMLVNK